MNGWGLNTFLGDPGGGLTVGAEWCALLADLGCTQVRCTIEADSANQLHLPWYQASADVYRAHGIDVLAVLTMATDMPWLSANIDRHFYPNEALGYQGNDRQNRYIRDFGYRAQEIAHALVPHGVTSYAIWNEPNLAACRPIGTNVPVVSGTAAATLAPEVWASLCYEVAGYLRAGGATDVQLGSISWIGNGRTGTDPLNPFGARYLSTGLEYLRGTGMDRLPWSHVAVNAELWWTATQAAAMADAVSGAFTRSGYSVLPLLIGEWGSRVAIFSAADAPVTAAALAGISIVRYFEQGPMQPDPTAYGLHGWSVAGGTFVPTPIRTAWWDAYSTIVGAPHAVHA